jgi:hypothetical protein
MTEDLDVFLLARDDCRTGTCFSTSSYGDYGFTTPVPEPGIYYIAVDGFYSVSDNYTLSVSCQPTNVYLPFVTK